MTRRIYPYASLSAVQRFRASWAGRRDAKRSQPYPEAPAGTPNPTATALCAHINAAIARQDADFRDRLRGLWPILSQDPAPLPAIDAAGGPKARVARAAHTAAASQAQASREAADTVVTEWHKARAAVSELGHLRAELMGVYASTVLRKHPDRAELAARGWQPVTPPLPEWVVIPGDNIMVELRRIGIPSAELVGA